MNPACKNLPRGAAFAGWRALVTGASGFIGSHLCRFLANHGARVHGQTRDAARTDSQLSWHVTDLTSAAAVQLMIEQCKPDYVFHLAAVTSAARDVSMVRATFDANVVSTINLLTALAIHPPKRFVLAGSLETPRVEADGAIAPSSPYAASKLAAGAYARLFNDRLNVPCVNARIFMVYGPGQRDVRKLIPYVTTSLLRGRAPKLSSGARQVDWVYVEDVARDLALAAIAPGIEGKTIDIGTGMLTPVSAVAEKLSQIMRSEIAPVIGQIADRPDEQVLAADVKARREMLGEAQLTQLDEGLSRTIDWYRAAIESGEIRVD